jgi:hypothetical protein
MHPWKLKRLAKVIQTYILDKKIFEYEWVFDLVTVKLNMETRMAKVEVLKDIVL